MFEENVNFLEHPSICCGRIVDVDSMWNEFNIELLLQVECSAISAIIVDKAILYRGTDTIPCIPIYTWQKSTLSVAEKKIIIASLGVNAFWPLAEEWSSSEIE